MLLVCYSYVLVWCFSHNSLVARVLRYFRAAQQILEPEDNDTASDPDNSGDDAQSDSSEMNHFIEHSYEVLFVPDTWCRMRYSAKQVKDSGIFTIFVGGGWGGGVIIFGRFGAGGKS